METQAADGAGSGDRLRQAPARRRISPRSSTSTAASSSCSPSPTSAPELEQAIRKTSAGGSTSLYNAIYIALKDLKKVVATNADEIRRQAIVVLSDGEDTSSLLPFEEVLDLAKRSETAIYAIGLRSADGPGSTRKGFKEAEFVLRQLAQETGGRAFFPNQIVGARRRSTGRSPTSCRASTRSATRRATAAATARGAASSSAWRGRTSPRGPSRATSRRPYRKADHERRAARPLRRRAGRVRLALRAAPAGGRPRGDDAARRGRAGAHLRHRHADDGGRARAGGRRDVGDLDVRLAAGARVPLHGDDDRRAGDGRVHPAAARRRCRRSRRSIPASRSAPTVLQGPLFGIHVSSLLFAYASFALACVIGITYVLLFKEIKAKHLGFFYARLPSLQVLDRMNQRAIVIGWIFLTIGMVVGAVWAAQARGGYAPGDPRVQAMSLQDPKIFVALVCWAGVLVRGVRGAAHRLGRAARGLSVGARLRDRAAELRADQLFPDEEPQLLGIRDQDWHQHCTCSWSESVIAPRRSSCASGSISRRAASTGALRALGGARIGARSGRALDLQPRRGVRRLRRRGGDARRIWSRFVSEFHGVDRPATSRRTSTSVVDLDVGAPSVPRRRRPRLARRRRAADSRAGEGGAHGRRATRTPPGRCSTGCFTRRSPSASGCGPKPASGRAPCRSASRRSRSRARSSATSSGRSVVVVGAGEMGKLTALHMKSQGVQRVTIVSRTMAHAARTAEAIGGAQRRAVGRTRRRPRRERHRHHRDRRGGADSHQGAHRGGDAAAAQPAAVHHRHRGAARRRGGGRRNRAGVPLQHRRSAGDGAREPGAPRQRGRARRGDRRRGGREVRRPGSARAARSRPSSRCGSGSRAIRRAELERLELQAVGAAARGARARRRDHAPDRREAAADADRAAQVAQRCRNRRRVLRSADAAVRPRRDAGASAARSSRSRAVDRRDAADQARVREPFVRPRIRPADRARSSLASMRG